MNSLIRDINEWTIKRVKASLDKDDEAYREAMFQLEGLVIDTQQELTYLTDWIEENVKENYLESENSNLLQLDKKQYYTCIKDCIHEADDIHTCHFTAGNVYKACGHNSMMDDHESPIGFYKGALKEYFRPATKEEIKEKTEYE